MNAHVLSVIEAYIGHQTYGYLMRDYFQQVDSCPVDFYWFNEDRELHTRILNRLLSYYSSNRWIQQHNIDLFLFRYQIGLAYMVRRLVIRKLAQGDYSALHFHTQPLAFLCLDVMRTVPTIVSLDRTIAQVAQERTRPPFSWTFQPNIYLEQKVFAAAQQIVSFSDAARRSVIDDYGIRPEKVITVYPGVDSDQILPAEQNANPERSLCNILFIGGDFERKGGYDVLDVFLKQFANRAKLHLVTPASIPGFSNGALGDDCTNIHPSAHPNVHLYPTITAYTPDWLTLYQLADLFVMPTYSEPFGWVFIEAMAAGLPIIATRHNAIPEIVIEGETGFLIEPGDRTALADRIEHLLEHPDLRREMGAKGRRVAQQKFNHRTHFEHLKRLFTTAMEAPTLKPSPAKAAPP
ncbi:glycosyltransferase family 4 protein [Myxacorys almedinensis]|uniref:Glycosyltransferase n=1 Tax=Myxacorys almedinensis A TaxID=2690445 RepID=A0A8J7YYZ0_9CYAN|nr:glycosyltransferase family 4 protein [Myxacorys almedinensis]NDJ16629.1 glycosyltransferase [Myxacorys almedinensis A]